MPNRNVETLNELDKSLKKFTSNGTQNKQIVLAGDFNCPGIDWDQCIVDPRSKDGATQQMLIDITAHLTQVHMSPTREDNLLDLVFTSNPSLVKSSVTAPGIFDHDIVITAMSTKPFYVKPTTKKYYQYSRVDWENLATNIDALSHEIINIKQDGSSTLQLWDKFKTTVLDLIDEHIPHKMRKVNYSLRWLSKPIMKMIKRKQRLYRRAKRNNKWDTYRNFQKKCKQQIRKAEWDFINNVIQEGLSNNNTKPFWRYIKTRRQDNVGVAPLKRNGTLVNDSVSKAEILVAQFKSVFTYDSTHHLPEVSRFIDQQIPHIRVHPSGVAKLLKNINTSKACGTDNISNTVLKTCADNIAPGLAAIYQSSIDSGDLPADWLNANISCVFKKGNKHLAENYRPISLTSVLCKQLEYIIYGHIMAYLESNKILTHLNHGFRRGYSCETQLIITLHDLLKSFDDKKQVDIAVLDFSKAFDTIPHSTLLHKLHCYGIRGTLHQWLTNFLTRRTMKVVLEGI